MHLPRPLSEGGAASECNSRLMRKLQEEKTGYARENAYAGREGMRVFLRAGLPKTGEKAWDFRRIARLK